MIRRVLLIFSVWLVSLLGQAACLQAETDVEIRSAVDELVHAHHFNGIDYSLAHALGPEAVPYLLELLADPGEREFWVNIIVTLGFIEDPAALPALVTFLEGAAGEVDIYTFRALLSVKYAIGCIAGAGDSPALQYLLGWADDPDSPPVAWSYQNKNGRELLYERSLMALAVSGRPEAKARLTQLKQSLQARINQSGASAPRDQAREQVLDTAFGLMDRIEKEGRTSILNH
jgi:HEAT repeat protein